MAQPEPENWIPSSEEEREAVRRQLEKVLRHPLFAHSQRYPALLRYVVEQAVAGTVDHIKERTIGVIVFGRNPSYDANADPVVRVTAGQIRKRLSQYYSELGQRDEIRIVLPTGSYVPQIFRLEALEVPLAESEVETGSKAEPAGSEVSNPVASLRPQPWPFRPGWLALWAAAALGIALVLVLHFSWWRRGTSSVFWKPMLDAGGEVALCVRPAEAVGNSAGSDARTNPQPAFSEVDVRLVLRLSNAVPELGGRVRFLNEDSASFETLRSGPVILMEEGPGGWNNRLASPLQFALVRQGTAVAILDRRSPAGSGWVDAHPGNEADDEQAYAVVARFFDPTLAEPVVLIEGSSPAGLAAGVEQVTTPRGMEILSSQLADHAEKKNLEVVVGAGVINGYPAAPRVLASHVW